MNALNNSFRLLGIAFLLQFITSFTSGVFVRTALIVPNDIGETMHRIAANPALMQGYILLDMVTALGIIFLGAMLFITLRKQNEKVALIAFGFYIFEAALLAASRLNAFSLLRLSQVYEATSDALYWETMAQIMLESMDFVGFDLHMLAFCLGALLFYTLLYQSRVVPTALSLWGLITILPLLGATLLGFFDIEVPFVFALPYVPFELVIGVWLLVKGAPQQPQTMKQGRELVETYGDSPGVRTTCQES